MRKSIIFSSILALLSVFLYINYKPKRIDTMDNENLIPRKILFGNPDKTAVRISRDGKYLSYISSLENVLNIFIAKIDELDHSYPITFDKGRGIRQYFWLYNNQHIIYLKDDGGDENWQIHALNINTKEDKILSPAKVNGRILGVSDKFPDEIIIGLNDRDERYHDLYKLNVITGEKTLIFENTEELSDFIIDDYYKIRFGSKTMDGGNTEYLKLSQAPDGKYQFVHYLTVSLEDVYTTSLLGFNNKGDILYMLDSTGKDLNSLKALNTKTGHVQILGEGYKAEINGITTSPKTGLVEAYSINYLKNEWICLDKRFEEHMKLLTKNLTGEIIIASRTFDDSIWIVADMNDDKAMSYYLYSTSTQNLKFLFTNKEDLKNYQLAKMEPIVIKARDGLELPSYITKPLNTSGPVPLVLLVHGGPWSRDDCGYDPEAQWLANRGYAVLQVNFRSSRGFGKSFVSKGNLEWGGKMHEDLLDAVKWAIDQKIADPAKVAVYGGSYGGYASLWAATNSPNVFKCAVDIVGPSNLNTLLATFPAYWTSFMEIAYKQVGDPRTEEGKKFLSDRSPLTHAEKLSIPLLIAQGEKDPRVKQDESEQFVKAMKEKNIPYIYMLFMDEGHGFARPENKIAFYGATEEFLAHNLGGKAEKLTNELEKTTLPANNQKEILEKLRAYHSNNKYE